MKILEENFVRRFDTRIFYHPGILSTRSGLIIFSKNYVDAKSLSRGKSRRFALKLKICREVKLIIL